MKTSKSKKSTTPASAPTVAPARVNTVKPAALTSDTPPQVATITAPLATVSAAPATPKTKPCREVTVDVIAARAYKIWEQKGRPQGCDLEHWVLAEKQLKEESRAMTA